MSEAAEEKIIAADPPYVVDGGVRYPIYLFEKDFELPNKGTYYLVTKSGVYLHKETKAGNALVKTQGIPWLEEPSVEFRLKLPKVPGRIIGQALTFFRKVWFLHKSEAYVTLLYSAKLNQYQLWCPKQEVSMASVNYDRTDQPSFTERKEDDWQMCGTIHSHCDFSAYHSGTDVGDEATFDGIHITLGHVNRAQFSMAASMAINEKRETLEPENCCSGVVRVANKEISSRPWMSFGDTFYFDLELSEEDAQTLVADTAVIDAEWMPKVTHRGFFTGGGSVGGFMQGKKGRKYNDEDSYRRSIDGLPDEGDTPGFGNSNQWYR
jgi:hypothetical protein